MASFFVKRFLNSSHLSNFLCRPYLPVSIQFCQYADVSNGPVKLLNERIAKGELISDEHQTKVVEALERVYTEIQGYEPEKPGFFSSWIGKGKKKKKTPKGLYLYGAVGGGKTMLMDLFYNCCQVSQFTSRSNHI